MFLSALEQGSANASVLKELARVCSQYPVLEPRSPPLPGFSVPLTPSPVDGSAARQLVSSKSDFWTQNRTFEQLFKALVRFLDPRTVRVTSRACRCCFWRDGIAVCSC